VKRAAYIKIVTNSSSEASELADSISKVTGFRLSNMRESENQFVAFMEEEQEVGDSTD
jgi:hypothetical protein